ncbi:MAG: hypothetical protein ABIH92_03535, partial [Nanoarchaeota archaeon]
GLFSRKIMTEDNVSEAVRKLGWKIAPTFWDGEGAKPLLDRYGAGAGDNTFLKQFTYDEQSGMVKGSFPLGNARLDAIVRSKGIRVATLDDLYKPEVRAMFDGRFYSDPAALALRGNENKGYSKNNPLIAQLVELVEDANGRVEFPLLVTGWDVEPIEGDDKGYGLKVVKRDDFLAVHDKRLNGENNGKRFNKLKDNLPDFEDSGEYTFYASDNATLARLCVDSDGDLNTNYAVLGNTDDDGRVVFLPAEGAAEILKGRFKDLERARAEQHRLVEEWYGDSVGSAPVKG